MEYPGQALTDGLSSEANESMLKLWGRELVIIFRIGWANSVIQLLQFLPGFFMMMFLPTDDELAGAGMGFMFGNVTGFSLIIGFGSGLIPLASQVRDSTLTEASDCDLV